MPSVTRRIEFDAGHRLVGHESKCAYLHGHRYAIEVTARASDTDDLGRVIDFGVLKGEIGWWIDDRLDHNMILNPDDPLVPTDVGERVRIFGTRAPFIMPRRWANPTAENIARVIFQESLDILQGYDLTLSKIRVYETPNCYADCTFEDIEADV